MSHGDSLLLAASRFLALATPALAGVAASQADFDVAWAS